MARQALGKGLGALIMKKQENTNTPPVNIVAESDRVIQAKVKDIKASPFQPRRRFDEQQIEELANSIRERGLIQPLVVRKVNGVYELIAGERRLRAVTRLGQTTVKVVIHEATDQEVAELALIENLQRADLTPLEEAEQYRLLQERFGMKQETIAQHVGKSRAVIANMIRLLDLAPSVRELLDQQQITVGHAKVLLQLKETDQQTNAALRVARGTLTVRQTEQLVRDVLNPSVPVPKVTPTLPPAYERVCSQLSNDFGTKVNISMKGKNNGVIEIPYAGREDLVRILQIFGISESI
ncbi:MAG: ParB/RepB/Spo0J family partition protein [Akkermansia sp.]|nr:ParB/RepB/Spo0J family partition protein [Akkermansia sp.]